MKRIKLCFVLLLSISSTILIKLSDGASTTINCGCNDCTSSVLNTLAGQYTCEARIMYLINDKGYSEQDACTQVAGQEFPSICGPACDPTRCDITPSPVPAPTPTIKCGCTKCTDQIWNTLAGQYTCGARITYLINDKGYSEQDACTQIASQEYPFICGPYCDPDKCNSTPAPITPEPTSPPVLAPTSLYCFPPDNGSRVTFLNMWDGPFKVQVKEGDTCGPGNNKFTANTVAVSGDELTLQFKKVGSTWSSSEVRIVLQDGSPFRYGNYTFHVKTVAVKDSSTSETISNTLPSNLVLGLFTWDDTDNYSIHENWSHEVDIEMSQWGSATNADLQFLVQPPADPQMYRFYSGSNSSYKQSNQWHSFKWLPNKIHWLSTAGGGHSHTYSTEQALLYGLKDYVQCLPADVEIRMNLWSIDGKTNPPDGVNDNQYVEVVIDNFHYQEDGISFADPGDFCTKHCQCSGVGGCVNGRCSQQSSPTKTPTMSPTKSPVTTDICSSLKQWKCKNTSGCTWITKQKKCTDMCSPLKRWKCNKTSGCSWIDATKACTASNLGSTCSSFTKPFICRKNGCGWNKLKKICFATKNN